jgi:hypothetical protein
MFIKWITHIYSFHNESVTRSLKALLIQGFTEIQHSQAARSILTYSATAIISKGAHVTRPDLQKGKCQTIVTVTIVTITIIIIIIIIIIIMQVDILKPNS